MNTRLFGFPALTMMAATVLLTGCGPSAKTASEKTGPLPVAVQTDWIAQAEHGGFYQAMAKGYYADAGIEVDVREGGPATYPVQMVATNQLAFSITRADEVLKAVAENVPLVIVYAYMQHDPMGILLHESNPVNKLKDLDGKVVMTTPGAYWISYMEAHYGIKMKLLPLTYGLQRFMTEKDFIQQCFVTNEPFYVLQAGGKPKTILLSESGYDPYRVIFTSRKFARENPEAVRAFVAASIKGWDEYMNGDSKPADAIIQARNKNMPDELLAFAKSAMREKHIVTGNPAKGERNGMMTRARMREVMEALVELNVLPQKIPLEKFVSFDFLPPDLQPLAGE